MKKHYRHLLGFVFSAYAAVFAWGCATTMDLHYEKPQIQKIHRGDIFVVVDDQRPADEGGDDPTRVGTIRNTFGMPFPLQSRADRDPSMVIKQMLTDCLQAAGLNVLEKPSDAPQLHVVIESFWSDGYQHSRVSTKLPSQLKLIGQSSALWKHTFYVNIGATWTVGYGPFNEGFNMMLEELKTQMLKEFSDPNFYSKLK